MNWPKISIVTPSYNQAPYLEETMLSVITQEYPALEYIVIDGGSTDHSREIIKKYEKHLCYWESKPDRGQSDAIKRGFQLATGSIIAWLNSDDFYEPGVLQYIAEIFMNEPEVGLVCGDRFVVDQDSKMIRTEKMPTFRRWHLHHYRGINQDSAFWRRDLYFQAGELNDNLHYAMDLDLWFRLSALTEIKQIPLVLSNYREHRESKSVIFNAEDPEIVSQKKGYKQELQQVRNQYDVSTGTLRRLLEALTLRFQKVAAKLRKANSVRKFYRSKKG